MGFELLRRWWPAIAVVVALTASHWFAYSHGKSTERNTWQAEWAQRDKDDATARADAERSARAKEQADQLHAEKVQRDATQALETARSDAAGERAATDRLRAELTRLQTRLSGTGKGAATGPSSASATRAAMVLSELYGSCQSRLGEVSSAFDRARIAGLACEASYDALR
jgi:Protein of unknown function (DUF2514).